PEPPAGPRGSRPGEPSSAPSTLRYGSPCRSMNRASRPAARRTNPDGPTSSGTIQASANASATARREGWKMTVGILQLPASSPTMSQILSPASLEPGLVFAFYTFIYLQEDTTWLPFP